MLVYLWPEGTFLLMIDGFMPGRSFKFLQARGPGQLWCEQKTSCALPAQFQIAGVAPGVQDGDSVGAVAQQPKLAAIRSVFTLWLVGGDKIVTWGNRDYGGDSSRDELRNVQQISCTGGAYAAILADGSVVAWGDPYYGGDCSGVQDELRNVQQIYLWHMEGFCCDFGRWKRGDMGLSRPWWWLLRSPRWAQECSTDLFVAHGGLLLRFWQMEAWWHGAVQTVVVTAPQSKMSSGMFNRFICGTWRAFAAILADGSVATWGCPDRGGDCSAFQDQLIYISAQVRARAVRANKKCGCHIPVLVAFVDFPAGCFS